MAADKEKGAAGSASAEIGKYLDILAKDPNSRVFAPLAEAYRKAGLLDDAIETALEGLTVHPNYLGGRVALGRALFEKGRHAEAAVELRKVIASAPDNIIAHKVLGQVALAQGDLPGAEKCFKMVMLLDPRDQEAKKVLADIGGGASAAAPPATVPTAPPPKAAPAPFVPAPAPPPGPAPAPATPVTHAAAASPWREMPLGDLSLEGFEDRRIPADATSPAAPLAGVPGPSAFEKSATELPPIDLEEPEEAAPPLPALGATAPAPAEPAAFPVLQEIEEGEAIPMPEIDEPLAPAAPPAAVLPPADAGEIEIFGRVPAGGEMPSSPPAEAAPAMPAAVASPPPPAESPFELFAREKRGLSPHTREEREAYAEIELEPTAQAPAAPAPEPEAGSEA
ncbi:MAG TPA: tetratricopeptide repeat protein, partial [Candidatus Methanoperedens sp.]|nr:tetratricopeptide repeat protein [Candidatus Methanoperedens sp.]